MRLLAAIGALWFLAAGSLAMAQIQVSAQTERSNFLLYARVDLLVTISNISDSDVTFDNDEGHPWLSFTVTRHENHNNIPVRPERTSNFGGMTVRAGQSQTLRINLTPLFTFRSEGDYRAAVVLDIPGRGEIVSEAVPFSVLHGHKIWSQIHPVDGSERIYSLSRFSPNSTKTELYLCVEDPAKNIVFANINLGEMVSFVDPDAFFDPEGNLHVLHPTATGTYLYSRADPSGKIEHQTIFKTFQSIPPRLRKLADGNIIVRGGLEQNPNTPRERLSTAQAGRSPNASADPSPADQSAASQPAANSPVPDLPMLPNAKDPNVSSASTP